MGRNMSHEALVGHVSEQPALGVDGLTIGPVRRILVPGHKAGGPTALDRLLVYGAAVDLAFLTEMSNLSPPIIHPSPSIF